MGFLYPFVLKHRALVIWVALVLTVVCGVLWLRVGIDFSLADYLPDDADSTQAIEKLNEIAGAGLPNASVYVENVTVAEALSIKEKLLAAKEAGMEKVVIPVENEKDLHETPREIMKGLEIHMVENMDQIIAYVLN